MLAAILLVSGTTVFTACSNDDDPIRQQDEYAGIPLIIYNTDIGLSTDDLFALEMLYRYEDEGRCRLLGVMVDREGEQNTAFADVMNTYFGHPDVTPSATGNCRYQLPGTEAWAAQMLETGAQSLFFIIRIRL